MSGHKSALFYKIKNKKIMAKTKTKDQETTLKSWLDVDEGLKNIAKLTSTKSNLESRMNAEMMKITEKYEADLNSANSEIIKHERNIELFCVDHKDEFGDKRSKELNYGVVSFRHGTPALKTLKGFTWDAVKNLIKASKKFREYLRVKEDIDKQALLKSRMKESDLAKIGCHISQEETFQYEAFIKESQRSAVE